MLDVGSGKDGYMAVVRCCRIILYVSNISWNMKATFSNGLSHRSGLSHNA